MPKIVVKRKAEIYKEFPIRPFQNKIRVGAEGDNDLIIEDKKVSMYHLIIEKEGTKYFVTDTDSAFGSHLNGLKLAQKTLLRSGDEIKIGDHTLQFENVLFESNNDNGDDIDESYVETDISTAQYEDLSDEYQDTQEIKTDKQRPAGDSQQFDTNFSTFNQEPYYLLAIYGPYLGKKYQLNFGVTKIGRDDTLNDIVIRKNKNGEIDPSISRRHATIFYENGDFYLSDKRSKTRTYLNRQLLDEDTIVQIQVNDEIEIVSDQKSTIFRVVTDSMMNTAPPQKCGEWWLRNGTLVSHIVSGLIILFLIFNLFSSWKKMNAIVHSPKNLKITEKLLFAEKNPIDSFNNPDEIKKLMNSLTPAIGDLNGDDILDFVYIDNIGYLHAISGANYQPLWKDSYKYRIEFPYHIVLEDLNGNDLPDIVIPTINSRISAIDGQFGNEIWTSPLLGNELSGAPAVVDLNGDKIKDICFCLKQGEIYIGYAKYGTPEWSSHQTNSEILSTPAAGDFNGDGVAEIAVGTENGEIFVFSGLSNNFSKIINVNEELQKAKGSFFEDHQIRNHISIGDFDGDKCDDMVLMTQYGNLLTISGKSFRRLWIDELPTDEVFSSNFLSPVGVGDLNNDKKADVVVFTTDKKIVAYLGSGKANGMKQILWGYMPEINEDFFTHPVVADINKDGNADVIAVGMYGGIYIFNGLNGNLLWQHEKINKINETIISTPLVADLKHDKILDIFVRRADNKFYDIITNTRTPENTLWWSQVNSNGAHTGSFNPIGISSSKYIVLIIISLLLMVGLVLTQVAVQLKRKKYFAI